MEEPLAQATSASLQQKSKYGSIGLVSLQVPYSSKFSWFENFMNLSKLAFKVNFRDKNFVITLNFRDSMLTHPFFSERAIEAKIYSLTDIFSDPRLQRSKHGNNSARSSEQQDMQALG